MRGTAQYMEMIEQGIENDGLQFCLDALQEEAAELIQRISHLRRNRCGRDRVIEEMADVQIMIDMVKFGMDGDIGFDYRILQKAAEIGFMIKWKKENNDAGKDTQA